MRQDTRTALLNAAERHARTRGFDGFSYADLAEDVGIRKASIHHHFPTKAALSVALMQRYYDDIEAACERIDATKKTAGERLGALVDHYQMALNGGESLCLCVSFSASPDSLPQEVTVKIGQFRAMILDWLAKVFEDAAEDGSIMCVQDSKAEAAAVLPLLEGAQLAARAQEKPALYDAAVQLLRHRLV